MIKVLVLLGFDLFRGKYENGYYRLTCGLELLDQGGVVNQAQISMKKENVHLSSHEQSSKDFRVYKQKV